MAESADITARDAHLATRLDPDVGMEQIAAVYAKALLGALPPDEQPAALADLDGIVDEVYRQYPRFEALLSSPVVSHREKSVVLDRVFAGRVAPRVLHFLQVVSRRGRLDCLRGIRRQAHRQYEELCGRIYVRVTTAAPLDAAQVAALTQSLQAGLGRELNLESAVDPAVIGGAVIRIGDTVYDASVANQLQSVRQQMIDRSVHEIQSRRDRFRNSTGS